MDQDRADDCPLEMWGGVECTVNRVGDRYMDQMERNGHAHRATDLDLFAQLGLRAIRYPALWERTAPRGVESADWSWPDERLGQLRDLGLRPIVGLMHHGSGPRDTSLVDPDFPERLADYASAVATRYPWVEDYTPVNEPLTTARFSALYGHWYPHARDDLSFARALLNQCRAVVLSMRAIRMVNPAARLVQTDDLGKTFSTSALAYQAELENERRWVTFDLLAGQLTPDRPMWDWLRRVGVGEAELAWFLDNPCPPDIMGINHYLSSERYLDHRLERYPPETHGGNGYHTYADVLAARVLPDGPAGPAALLREAWERYRLPMAVTEAHNGGTREEQLRWLDEVWRAAHEARLAGADIRAVTVWSLLGAYDWHHMVTREEGYYEPGVFDLRSPSPRPTAIARMVRDLATECRYDHPLLAVPGWWRRPDRFIYQHASAGDPPAVVGTVRYADDGDPSPVLVVGNGGPLTRALAAACDARKIPYRALSHRDSHLSDWTAPGIELHKYKPWAVIDLGDRDRVDGFARGASARSQPTHEATILLATTCAEWNLPFVTFSSDLVFDGRREDTYIESSRMVPDSLAGQQHADAETGVRARHPDALVLRTGPLFGAEGADDFVVTALEHLVRLEPLRTAAEEVVSPTYLPDVAEATLDLLVDGETGLWHLANQGAASWVGLVGAVAAFSGLADAASSTVRSAASDGGARRSRVLGSERGSLLPSLDDALVRRLDGIQAIHSSPGN